MTEQDDRRLVAAVRAGDAEAVRTLLEAGADPDATDGDAGLPVLCTPEVTEVLVALLAEEEQELRLEGAYGLALRDDPRTREAYARVGPLGPQYEYDRRADGLWRWARRNERDDR
ncbi:hypothetical protein AB0I68_25390 [Streptomyces sp. NPDC050448]|uniref:hypothetical protein n=1 Tax=Streptomyces sp. NPDC050448 TaxID=3155404 RepID=UPI0034297F80